MNRIGKIVSHGGDVSLGHIRGDRLNLRPGAFQFFPKRSKCLFVFTLADEDDASGVQIQDKRHVFMALGDRNFIDGDVLDFLQWNFAVLLLEPCFSDAFNRFSGNPKMQSDIQASHASQEVEHVSLEKTGIPFVWFGKTQLDLLDGLTVMTVNPWNLSNNRRGLAIDRHRPKPTFLIPFSPPNLRPTLRALKPFVRNLHVNLHAASHHFLTTILVATNPQHVIQYRCGHFLPPYKRNGLNISYKSRICPLFQPTPTLRYTLG